MKLEKAIEILNLWVDNKPVIPAAKLHIAARLGIEAIKWRQLMEHDYSSWCGPPLLGETEN